MGHCENPLPRNAATKRSIMENRHSTESNGTRGTPKTPFNDSTRKI